MIQIASRRLRFTVVLGGIGLAASACTVPTNDKPQPIAIEDIPAALLETTTTSTTTIPAVPKDETIYFLRAVGSQTVLVPVVRQYPIDAGINAVLNDLIENPPDNTGTERVSEAGLTSSIPDPVELITAEVDASATIITVNVRGLFGESGLEGDFQIQAAAQIVYTATSEDDTIVGVLFLSDGLPVAAPVPGSDLSPNQPATRADYRSFLS